MAGYVIHLAIGEEYIRKHKGDIKNKEEFLKGVIAPDNTNDKLQSHYGEKNLVSSLKKFIDAKQDELDSDYIKGYFIHLFTDYIFYCRFFTLKHYYEDYDITNKTIIEKYGVKVPEELKEYAKFVEGEPEHLKYHLLYELIEEVTKNKIKDNILKIKKGECNEYKN